MNFKIINCGFFDSTVICGNIRESKERVVEYYEIELFTKDGETSYVGNKSKRITAGTVLFAKPNEIRHSVFPFKAYYVRFEVCSNEFIKLFNTFQTFSDASQNVKKILKCMNDIFDEERLANYNNPILECKMHKLIDELVLLNNKSIEKRNAYSNCSESVKNAIEYINENYSEKLSIKSVASAIHLSPIYFHGLFKMETGITPYEYITKKRIERAVNLLETTDTKIATISSECGFSSQSHFTDVFKKEIGCTPNKYRKSYNDKYIS